MSKSLWPHELQHTRPPCSSPALGAYSNSCPSSQWCHPTISFSVVPFSSHLQSFPASESFQMSQFFPSDWKRLCLLGPESKWTNCVRKETSQRNEEGKPVCYMANFQQSHLTVRRLTFKRLNLQWESNTEMVLSPILKPIYLFNHMSVFLQTEMSVLQTEDEMVGWHHWLNGHEFG